MSTDTVQSKMPKGWLWAFIVAEAILVFSWLTLDTMNITRSPGIRPFTSPEVLLRLVHGGMALLLMVASPFFLQALRWVALLGWVLGFLALWFGNYW